MSDYQVWTVQDADGKRAIVWASDAVEAEAMAGLGGLEHPLHGRTQPQRPLSINRPALIEVINP